MSARVAIGLTGDVGSGKSTVLAWLAEHGAATLDGDALVHALLAGDATVVEAVIDRFGPAVRSDGGIRRAALAELVFADPAALADLERIVHPAVLDSTRAWLSSLSAEVAIVEAVKLVESGFHAELDRLWLVVCDAAARRGRLMARGWTPQEVDRRMAAATPLAAKLVLADVVIDNSGSRVATERQLEAAWRPLWRPLRLDPPTRPDHHSGNVSVRPVTPAKAGVQSGGGATGPRPGFHRGDAPG